MKKIYTTPTAEIILLQECDVLTASGDWVPGENETERAYSTASYSSYPIY